MTNTINNNIPFVPENTIDLAAGLNLALNSIDAILQLRVLTVGTNAPPASPANGDRHIVGASPTGLWAGQAGKVARWLDGYWSFYDARYAINAADGSFYIRAGATWGTGGYTAANILGTVSQSGGVPTGAIIERGSNANGEYVKFADGTMIVIGSATGLDVTAAAGSLFRATSGTLTLAAEFTGTGASRSGSAVDSAGSLLWGAVSTNNATTCTVGLMHTQSITGRTARYMVIGRWL